MTASQCPDALDLISPKQSFSIYVAVPTFKKCIFLISFISFFFFPPIPSFQSVHCDAAEGYRPCGHSVGMGTGMGIALPPPCSHWSPANVLRFAISPAVHCIEAIEARAEVHWKWCFCTTKKKSSPANKPSGVFPFSAG